METDQERQDAERHKRLLELLSTVDRELPYTVNGRCYAPARLLRTMTTRDEVRSVLSEMLDVRATDVSGVSSSSGVPEEDVWRLLREGRGTLSNLRRVLDALGVVPEELPSPFALSAERTPRQ